SVLSTRTRTRSRRFKKGLGRFWGANCLSPNSAASAPRSLGALAPRAWHRPRKSAQRPWLALGSSRSRDKAREQASVAAREAVHDRLQWQLAELRANLEKIAAATR